MFDALHCELCLARVLTVTCAAWLQIADSDSASFFVHPGDIIVMGSDGLLDNVSDQEILDEVTQSKVWWGGHMGLIGRI